MYAAGAETSMRAFAGKVAFTLIHLPAQTAARTEDASVPKTFPKEIHLSLVANRYETGVQPDGFVRPFGTSMSTRHPVWLGIALIVFLLQVLPFLSYRWVTDESWYCAPGYSVSHGGGLADPAIGPNDVESRFDARPPGTALVIAGFLKLLGTGQTEARLGSVVAGLLVVLTVWRLAADVFGPEAAAVAAMMAGTENFLVAAARTARPEALTTMAVAFAMPAMYRYSTTLRLAWAVATGLLMALGAMFHITVLGYVIALGLLAIVVDRKSGRFPLAGAIAYSLGFLAGLMPFCVWILTTRLGPQGFREEHLARTHVILLQKLQMEVPRYRDMFGLHVLHGHGLDLVPVRLPIVLCVLAASFVLFRYARRWFYVELVLLIPTLLWFVETANKSSRYMALLAPVLALVMGAAVSAVRDRRTVYTVAVGVAVVAIALQFLSNVVLLAQAREANYNKVEAELRGVVPAGQPVYATMTFWLAFHDHPYISYERTLPWVAVKDDHVRYFILGDRMMSSGSDPMDPGFYPRLSGSLAQITSGSDLVGEFPDPYYGDLRVYRLRDTKLPVVVK